MTRFWYLFAGDGAWLATFELTSSYNKAKRTRKRIAAENPGCYLSRIHSGKANRPPASPVSYRQPL